MPKSIYMYQIMQITSQWDSGTALTATPSPTECPSRATMNWDWRTPCGRISMRSRSSRVSSVSISYGLHLDTRMRPTAWYLLLCHGRSSPCSMRMERITQLTLILTTLRTSSRKPTIISWVRSTFRPPSTRLKQTSTLRK